jgi:hypothetical protein
MRQTIESYVEQGNTGLADQLDILNALIMGKD